MGEGTLDNLPALGHNEYHAFQIYWGSHPQLTPNLRAQIFNAYMPLDNSGSTMFDKTNLFHNLGLIIGRSKPADVINF